jgi:hypothetical protein
MLMVFLPSQVNTAIRREGAIGLTIILTSTPLTSEEVAERVRYTKKVGDFEELGQPMPHRMSLEKSTRIFCKYLKPKPHIMALVDDFWEHIRVDGPVVGIHFRGSDKITEAPRVSWEHCLNDLANTSDNR